MSRASLSRRYGLVSLLTLGVLAAMVAMPATPAGAGGILVLKGSLLALAVASSGRSSARGMTGVVLVAGLAAIGAVLTGEVPASAVAALGGIFVLAAAATVAGTAVDLLRAEGVTVQLVFAGLTVYLLVGLVFADIIGAVVGLTPGAYFAQGTDGSQAERVYYSFMTLTTTGFGDFTPATGSGRAIAVLETVTGQIYLVTVIGLLVGNLPRRVPPLPPAA